MPLIKRERISKTEWEHWRSEPATQQLIADLHERREELKEGLAEGSASTEALYNQTIGRCMDMKDIIRYIVHEFDYIEKETEVSQNGDSTGSLSGIN